MLQEYSYKYLDELYNFYVLPSVSSLARDLKIDVDTLVSIHERKQPINDSLAKQLMYLWALKLGKTHFPGLKPVLEAAVTAERLQRAFEQIDDLYELYPSISKLAIDLGIDIDALSRIHARKGTINDALAKKIMHLWAVKLGRVYFPGPKPVLEEEVSADRLQRAFEQIDYLYKLYPSISKLASDLNIDIDDLSNVISRKDTIRESLAKKIMYLWALKLGTVYFPGPKPILDQVLEMEIIEKSSAFFYRDRLYGKKDPYKDVVFWDILPELIKIDDYAKDNALLRVRKKIIPLINEMYKTLQVETSEHISFVDLYGDERRPHRTFELHIIEQDDRDTNKPKNRVQYGLSYSQGDIQVWEDIPAETAFKIVYVLRTEGIWE